jgi:hypothetical protein
MSELKAEYTVGEYRQFMIDIVEQLGELDQRVHLLELQSSNVVAPEVCGWKYHLGRDWDEGYWSTSCGNDWYFTEGTPETNRVKYCPYCGKPIKAVMP